MVCLIYLMFYIAFISRTLLFIFENVKTKIHFEKWVCNTLIHGVWGNLAYIDLPITLTVMFGALKPSITIYLPSFRIQERYTAPIVRHFSFPTSSKIAAGDLQAIAHIKYSSSSWCDLCDTAASLPILSGQPHRSQWTTDTRFHYARKIKHFLPELPGNKGAIQPSSDRME